MTASAPDTLPRDELRARRAALGLSQIGFARIIGVNPRTAVRWETDQQDIPTYVGIVLRCLEYEAGIRAVPRP